MEIIRLQIGNNSESTFPSMCSRKRRLWQMWEFLNFFMKTGTLMKSRAARYLISQCTLQIQYAFVFNVINLSQRFTIRSLLFYSMLPYHHDIGAWFFVCLFVCFVLFLFVLFCFCLFCVWGGGGGGVCVCVCRLQSSIFKPMTTSAAYWNYMLVKKTNKHSTIAPFGNTFVVLFTNWKYCVLLIW